MDDRITVSEFEKNHPGTSWKVFIRNIKNYGLPIRPKYNQKFYFTKDECENIYLIERWSKSKFEETYPDVSWQAFLYQVRQAYKLPKRIRYTTNDELILSELTEEEKDIIAGSLLGDGTIVKHKSGSCYFRIAQGAKQLEYLEWKKNKLSRIILQQNPIYQEHEFGNTNLYIANALREFRKWESDWYIKQDNYSNLRTKIVPMEYLDYLTELGLAIWFLDDGSCSVRSATIATNAFSPDDLDTLRLYLVNRWNLNATITKYGTLSFSVSETNKLFAIIGKYITQIPSMIYKLGSSNESVEIIRKAPEKDEDMIRSAW